MITQFVFIKSMYIDRSKTFDYVVSLPTFEVPLASFKSSFEAKVNKILNFLQLLLSAFCLRFSVIHYCWSDTLQTAKMFLIPHVELFLISAKILFQCVPVSNFLLPLPTTIASQKPWKIEPFTCVIFPGFWFLLYF